jgi:tetratricopeptide (TPR) repeat protein
MFGIKKRNKNGPVVVRRGEKPKELYRHNETEEHHTIREDPIDFTSTQKKIRLRQASKRQEANQKRKTVRIIFFIIILIMFGRPLYSEFSPVISDIGIKSAERILLTIFTDDIERAEQQQTTIKTSGGKYRYKNPALNRIMELTDLSHPPYLRKDYALSISYLEQMIKLGYQELGPDLSFSPSNAEDKQIAHYVGLANTHIATIYADQYKYDKAEDYNRKAFNIWERVHGQHYKDTIIALEKVADMQFQQKKYSVSRQTYTEIARIYDTWTPSRHEEQQVAHFHATAVMMIGVTYEYDRNYKKAYLHLIKARQMAPDNQMILRTVTPHIKYVEKRLGISID